MNEVLKKEDFDFLIKAIDKRLELKGSQADTLSSRVGENDKVNGDISIPEPVEVNVNGTMSKEDYKACSTVMAVCQNMVQKSITDAAKAAGIEPGEALKNMNAWVQGYVDFPFPFFNFKDTQSDDYKKNDFSLEVDPEVVEQIINIKNVTGLKDAVLGALKKSGGNMASYQGTDRRFNYFGVISGYNETEISTRVIKFQMNLKTTNVKSLCVTYSKTNLDTSYDTYQFVADKELMIKVQEKMGDKMVEYFAEELLEFIKQFYDRELENYNKKLIEVLKDS